MHAHGRQSIRSITGNPGSGALFIFYLPEREERVERKNMSSVFSACPRTLLYPGTTHTYMHHNACSSDIAKPYDLPIACRALSVNYEHWRFQHQIRPVGLTNTQMCFNIISCLINYFRVQPIVKCIDPYITFENAINFSISFQDRGPGMISNLGKPKRCNT